jgi:hypothetical protein
MEVRALGLEVEDVHLFGKASSIGLVRIVGTLMADVSVHSMSSLSLRMNSLRWRFLLELKSRRRVDMLGMGCGTITWMFNSFHQAIGLLLWMETVFLQVIYQSSTH